MNQRIQIVGQGIAGSMLAWQCAREGVDFRVVDRGHATSASRVGAGLVSPLTGKRLVPTWRFADWRDEVLAIYRELESELNVPLVREMRIRRYFRDQTQRELFEKRREKPEVARWVESFDYEGLWLHGALQVETGTLIAALRERWLVTGQLVEGSFEATTEGPVIWCLGANAMPIDGIPWQPSRGELITGELPRLAEDVILNDGKWLLPIPGGRVRVGSTFDRKNLEVRCTEEGIRELTEAAARLAGRPIAHVRGDAGLRVTVPDHRPVAGWTDDSHSIGVFAGLAAKGALWAPALARQWVADGLAGTELEPEVTVTRFD